MMDIGTPELIVVLAIVLLIFGPGRILNIARELGAGIQQFRQGLEGSPDAEDEEK